MVAFSDWMVFGLRVEMRPGKATYTGIPGWVKRGKKIWGKKLCRKRQAAGTTSISVTAVTGHAQGLARDFEPTK